MSSNVSDPPVTELLLVIVFQLGVCILFLAEVADAARGYDTLSSLAGQLVGTVTAVGAVTLLFVRRKVR